MEDRTEREAPRDVITALHTPRVADMKSYGTEYTMCGNGEFFRER